MAVEWQRREGRRVLHLDFERRRLLRLEVDKPQRSCNGEAEE
jgi:hypothetical protein